MKAKLIREMDRLDRDDLDSRGNPTIKKLSVGTVIDHPDAFRLVQQGCAIADDDECHKAAGMTADRLAAAQQAYKRVEAGIHPEEFEAFDAGLMTGYHPDGSWILGPAAEQATDQDIDDPLLEDEETLNDE